MKIKAMLFFMMILFDYCHASDGQPTYCAVGDRVFNDDPVVHYRAIRQQNMSVSLEKSTQQGRRQSPTMEKLANIQKASKYVEKQQLQEIAESDSVDIDQKEKSNKYLVSNSGNQNESAEYGRLKNFWLYGKDKSSAKTEVPSVSIPTSNSYVEHEKEPSIIKIVCASQARRSERRWFVDWLCCRSNSAVINSMQQKK